LFAYIVKWHKILKFLYWSQFW